jgi:hypothetical protein
MKLTLSTAQREKLQPRMKTIMHLRNISPLWKTCGGGKSAGERVSDGDGASQQRRRRQRPSAGGGCFWRRMEPLRWQLLGARAAAERCLSDSTPFDTVPLR